MWLSFLSDSDSLVRLRSFEFALVRPFPCALSFEFLNDGSENLGKGRDGEGFFPLTGVAGGDSADGGIELA